MNSPNGSGSVDVSAIITAHGEGVMAGVSLRSMIEAVKYAKAKGINVECIVTLDKPLDATRKALEYLKDHDFRMLEFELGDQGLVRNAAVEASLGRYVAFLDADDLWSVNWLDVAYRLCESDPGRTIAHPEYNWFFEMNNSILLKVDDQDPLYDPEFLRFANYWDALCMAPRSAHLNHPFCVRDVKGGFAYEDWHWNCETVNAGYRHAVCEDTIHFKRRREDSQTMKASRAKVMMRPTPMMRYGWYSEQETTTEVAPAQAPMVANGLGPTVQQIASNGSDASSVDTVRSRGISFFGKP